MARPERKNADYFPFYSKDGRTLFLLESKYRCKGTGFFTNVMRFLTLQEDHYFCIGEETDKMYFFAKCHCDIESGMDMLNMMSKTGKIDAGLWVSSAVIVSEDLLNSLEEAYRKRKNTIISMQEIHKIHVSPAENPESSAGNELNGDIKPQRKGKETKGNKKGKLINKITGNNSHPEKIYYDYVLKIIPFRKSKFRAVKNIGTHLKKHSIDDLLSSIKNYALIALESEPGFRKDPANFFGVQEPAFVDYLPINFEPPEVKAKKKDWKNEF